ISRYNVVLTYIPGIGKANTAAVAANCQASFPNVKLALIVGISGAIPFSPNSKEIILGDVIISNSVIQFNPGRQLFSCAKICS
ncbi:hypothetical protein BKA56DRAFT_483563, partial [Ilyonectria sp. MPI-CAGE-AT-0026]